MIYLRYYFSLVCLIIVFIFHLIVVVSLHLFCAFKKMLTVFIGSYQAYSLHDREVGYCQGSGFIVGLLLMQVRKLAFYCIKFVVFLCIQHFIALKLFCYMPACSALYCRKIVLYLFLDTKWKLKKV